MVMLALDHHHLRGRRIWAWFPSSETRHAIYSPGERLLWLAAIILAREHSKCLCYPNYLRTCQAMPPCPSEDLVKISRKRSIGTGRGLGYNPPGTGMGPDETDSGPNSSVVSRSKSNK